MSEPELRNQYVYTVTAVNSYFSSGDNSSTVGSEHSLIGICTSRDEAEALLFEDWLDTVKSAGKSPLTHPLTASEGEVWSIVLRDTTPEGIDWVNNISWTAKLVLVNTRLEEFDLA